MHTYIEAAEGVEMPALKIYLLLCVFHQLCADCEKMTLGKQTRKKNTVTLYKSMQINKLFSDFLFFFVIRLSIVLVLAYITPSGRAFVAHALT